MGRSTPNNPTAAKGASLTLPRRFRLLLTAVLAVTLAVGGTVTAPPAAATVNRASIALRTSYLLRSVLSYTYGTISSTERISITNVSGAAIDRINLSVMPRAFGELTSIGSFLVDGRAVTGRWTNNSNLELLLGRDLANGASATVTLKFAVKATGAIGTSLEGRLSKANGIMQVSHWFPIVSDGHGTRYPGDSQFTRAARLIRLELTTDSSSVRIAAPGRIVSSSGRNHVFEIEYARDFAFGASPSYKVLSGTAGGVTVAAYYTTGNGAAALTNAKAALAKFEAVFGQYMWPRYVVAQTGRTSSGNEYPGIVFIGGPLLANREVVVHETAHQWWYGMVGNDQLREPWLDEGISEFATSYFYAGFHSYSSTRPVNSSVYEFPNEPATTAANGYVQTVYYKSAHFLNGLRVRMGNTAFFSALRDLFAKNLTGTVTTVKFYDTMARYGAPTTYMRQFIRI